VYRGVDRRDGTEVALKFLISDEDVHAGRRLAHFRREADIIRRLDHEAIVKVRDFVYAAGQNLMIMDLFLGPYDEPVNLRDYVNAYGDASGLIDQGDMRQIALRLLNAVGYAHQCGVVHCDIKPENVLFQYTGVEEQHWYARLELTDFGLARIVGQDLVLASATTSIDRFGRHGDAPSDGAALRGTFLYMSAEQRRGLGAGPTSDLFAIGVMIHRLLTGAEDAGQGLPSALRPELHRGWDRIVSKATQEDPAQRYAYAVEMAMDIDALPLQGEPRKGFWEGLVARLRDPRGHS
jgi:serine/threonine-protein kinase